MLQLRLALAEHRNAGTLTSAIELQAEVDEMRQTTVIESTLAACKAAGVKIPADNGRLALRQTKGGYVVAKDGRKATRSKRDPRVMWVDAPPHAVWDARTGQAI